MSYQREARTLRDREDKDRNTQDNIRQESNYGSTTKLVWTVSNGSYPTVPNVTYAVQEVRSTGQEDEGYPLSFEVISPTFFAQILGTKVPPQHTYLLVTGTEGRWIGRYG